MEYEQFVGTVMRLGAFGAQEQAERAIAATLATLGERLYEDEARALAAHLPDPLAQRLTGHGYSGDFDRAELFDRVARREGAELGFAIEHAEVVCRVLGEALPDEARTRLCRHLPADLADLFAAAAAPEAPPRVHHAPEEIGSGRTLATGRPGSHHPLSEGRPERAHSESVARSEDPHADSRLSSSHGLTQERLEESLATARPERGRSLGEGRE